MATPDETVFALWCRLTGNDASVFSDEEREAFLARPQVSELSRTPYPLLLDSGITAARRGSLPLERWLAAARVATAGTRGENEDQAFASAGSSRSSARIGR